MNKKLLKIVAFMAAMTVAASCSGEPDKGADIPEELPEDEWEYEEEVLEEVTEDEGVYSVRMMVDKFDGKLEITRNFKSELTPMGESGTWTIFVYMCGSDLESGNSMASMDIEEMLVASGSDKVRFVVETGGADEWYTEKINASEKQRFVIQNGEISCVYSDSAADMGEGETLSDFLSWGVENYAAERMGVVFWNHGGGSISGVCFDELNYSNSLSLRELDNAFLEVSEKMTDKFEFVGFDACLMGTIEAANVLATYADYMYGSQEFEPGGGWDYTAIGNALAENSLLDGAELGKIVCDSYYEACDYYGEGDSATLSVIDLGEIDELIVSFNDFSKQLYESTENQEVLVTLIRAIEQADNFGGNNKNEGYTNMVDLSGIVSGCGLDGSDAVISALDNAVVYKVNGSTHYSAGGLSIYYPLSLQGSQELSIFAEICVSPYYLSFVDKMCYGAANSGYVDDYDNEYLLGDETEDEWWGGFSYDLEEDGGYYYYFTEDDYWYYADDYCQTGESSLITFDTEPAVDDDGCFGFVLDEDGLCYASAVSAIVFATDSTETDLIEMGQTYDFNLDWSTGEVTDNFDGYWLSLPDGQNLAMYVAEETTDYVIYTSPILLNNEETNLRIRQSFADTSISIEGAWDGIDEYGMSSREIKKLSVGDVITPMYYSYEIDSIYEGYYYGEDYTFDGDPEIIYSSLPAGDYYYSFCIDDIYGDYFLTDSVIFTVDEDGSLYFTE